MVWDTINESDIKMAIPLPYIDRIILEENLFIEAKILDTEEGIKFSIVLIKDNKRVIGFDNHEGRKPHKHIKNKVYPYDFQGVGKLIQDFYEEIEKFLKS